MITVIGGIEATVRIDMTMPGSPAPAQEQQVVSPWEQEAYGSGGRFGNMGGMPSGDPAKDRITVSYSGCAYKTAKYLANAGQEVAFVSVVGEDPLGLAGIADLTRAGVNTEGIQLVEHLSDAGACGSTEEPEEAGQIPAAAGPVGVTSLTSVKVIAKNFLGDTQFWREDSRMLDEITPARLQAQQDRITGADLVFMDGSLPEETIGWVAGLCAKAEVPLYFDPASIEGGSRAVGTLHGLTGIMPGRREAEAMSGLDILSADQLMQAGAHFQEQGIQRIVITMKGGGLYYKEGLTEGILRPDRVLKFGETTGAGDVVTAQLLLQLAEGHALEEAAQAAMDAAADFLKDVVDERRY